MPLAANFVLEVFGFVMCEFVAIGSQVVRDKSKENSGGTKRGGEAPGAKRADLVRSDIHKPRRERKGAKSSCGSDPGDELTELASAKDDEGEQHYGGVTGYAKERPGNAKNL